MRHVTKLIRKRKHGKHIIYHYQLDDGLEVTSKFEHELGTRVEVFFRPQFNAINIRPYKPKRRKHE
jgi:hypothetical protein